MHKAVALKRISFGCIVNTFDKSRLWSISQISCTDRVTVKKCYVKSRKTGIAHIYNEKRLTAYVISCAGTAYWNTILKKI